MARILDVDPLTGSWETFEYNDADDQVIIKRFQDVEPMLNANKRVQGDGWSRKEVMWKAAEIPVIFIHKWLVEDGVNVLRKENWPWLRRKLNDPEWRDLRPNNFKV